MKKQIQAGFTLIELIVVIVILGILAAVAIPKFVDLSKDARGGVMKGVEAAMRGADTMIYAKSAAVGLAYADAATTSKVSVNSQDVLTKFGYAKDVKELNVALTLNPSTDFNVNATATVNRIEHKGAKDFATAPQNCAVTYVPAADANTPPTYTTETSGC